MNIVLGTPPWDFSKAYGISASKRSILNKRYGLVPGESEPLGILYLASTLLKNGYNVSIIDGYNRGLENWLDEIERLKPEIVGLSCSSYVWDNVMILSKKIKSRFPDVYIAVGGPHITGIKQQCFLQNKHMDFAIPGEGEITFLELCNAIRDKKPLTTIDGLIFKERDKIIENKAIINIKDLDSLPFPAREKINILEYRPSIGFYNALPTISIIGSRGCPYRCNFCISNSDLRQRSIENIIREIEECIQKYKIKHVVFWDENIIIGKNRIFEFCDALLTKNLKITWCASARVDAINKPMLKLIKKAGCWKLLFGLETGVEKNLKKLNKTITLEQARQALSLVKKANIESFGTFMFGIPEETFEEGLETIKFACSLPLDYAAFLYLCPFPGSELYNNIEKYGTLTGIWATTNISFIPYSMTLEQMQKLGAIAYKKFYMRPSYLLRRALKIRGFTDLNRNLRGFFAYSSMYPGNFG